MRPPAGRTSDGRRNPRLRQFVRQRLDQRRSPHQISVALRQEFPDDPEMQAD
ncbi:hypothetical protein [Parafrankia sp. EUN1f]|uniref:hypothetical protein n=1 Tax=Parafrankia sp. EUN1f TaxID=102897 RepID=UPI0012FC8946|nr:hypothetical protein [Parafrankia sp. EUN1f]